MFGSSPAPSTVWPVVSNAAVLDRVGHDVAERRPAELDTAAPATGRPWMSRIVSTQNISFRPLGTQASVLLASELTVFVMLFETLLA